MPPNANPAVCILIILIILYPGTDDFDTESTDVTATGVAYRRSFAVSSLATASGSGRAVVECSMQFEVAVQPTASLPELTDSPIPPDYKYTWRSTPIPIIGETSAAEIIKPTPPSVAR